MTTTQSSQSLSNTAKIYPSKTPGTTVTPNYSTTSMRPPSASLITSSPKTSNPHFTSTTSYFNVYPHKIITATPPNTPPKRGKTLHFCPLYLWPFLPAHWVGSLYAAIQDNTQSPPIIVPPTKTLRSRLPLGEFRLQPHAPRILRHQVPCAWNSATTLYIWFLKHWRILGRPFPRALPLL